MLGFAKTLPELDDVSLLPDVKGVELLEGVGNGDVCCRGVAVLVDGRCTSVGRALTEMVGLAVMDVDAAELGRGCMVLLDADMAM